MGVSPSATDEEVKKAYRDLVRKYHPDKYADNPLKDVASEKMKEINAAYDQIQKNRKAGRNSGYGNQGGYYNGGYQGNYTNYGGGAYGAQGSQFPDIRRLISQNRIAEAEELLDGVPDYRKNAEWYFLKGSVYYRRGWLGEAARCFQRSYQAEPQNPEYAAAFQRVSYQQQYGTRAGSTDSQWYCCPCGCDPCDCCAGMMCFDCLCNGC